MSSKELIKNISFSEVGESGKQMPMDELREYQVNVGIHLSHHRLKILEYLTKHRTHPTVDIIYKNLLKEIHTLSKTTIYKHDTIKVFTSKGIFKCMKCKNVYDIAQESEDKKAEKNG